MRIAWDPVKARENLAKHRISFEEAATALEDPLSAIGPDPDHSFDEERFVAFGMSPVGRLWLSRVRNVTIQSESSVRAG